MTIHIKDILAFIISFQSIVFALILIFDDNKKRIDNRYLSLFLVVIGIQFMTIVSDSFGLISDNFEFIFYLYGFVYGPIFYLYSKSLIYKSFKFSIKQLYHFTPTFLISIFLSTNFISSLSIAPLIYVSLLLYLTLSIREIVIFRKVIKDTQSSKARKNLVWLQWTIIIFCMSLFLDIVDQFLFNMDLIFGASLMHLSLLLLVNWMYYRGLKQSKMFLGISEIDQKISFDTNKVKGNLCPSNQDRIEIDRIKEFMDTNNVFTNPDLSLNQLAEYLEISPRRLSYLINNFLNQNFMSFINSYRLDRAKYQLLNPKKSDETISEIMYDVGFNSKSSFYTLFRKNTGLTPSEFKKKSSI